MIVPRYANNAYEIGHVVLWVSSLLVSVFMLFLMIYLLFVNTFYSSADSCYVNIREAPQSKHKHSWVVFLTASHPSFTHQTTDAGWWVFVFLVKKKNHSL